MKKMMHVAVFAVASSMVGTALAKLPAPSDEAKAKAAEAAAKTAWAGKVDAYRLCLAQDRVAAYYKKHKGVAADKAKPAPAAPAAGAPAAGAPAAAACADPGPFVYTPAPPAGTAVAAAPAAPAAPAAAPAAAAVATASAAKKP